MVTGEATAAPAADSKEPVKIMIDNLKKYGILIFSEVTPDPARKSTAKSDERYPVVKEGGSPPFDLAP